jgi:hypothetical protein
MITEADLTHYQELTEAIRKQCELWCTIPGAVVDNFIIEGGAIHFTEDAPDYEQNEHQSIPLDIFETHITPRQVKEFRDEVNRKAAEAERQKNAALIQYQEYNKKQALANLIAEFPDYAREVLNGASQKSS